MRTHSRLSDAFRMLAQIATDTVDGRAYEANARKVRESHHGQLLTHASHSGHDFLQIEPSFHNLKSSDAWR